MICILYADDIQYFICIKINKLSVHSKITSTLCSYSLEMSSLGIGLNLLLSMANVSRFLNLKIYMGNEIS